MRRWILVLGMLFPLALFAQAPQPEKQPHTDKERRDDIKRHRALAAVHEAAAKCLEAGRSEKECQEKLRQDCKGLGIGKYCGMKHQH
jgi:hypothetical protein